MLSTRSYFDKPSHDHPYPKDATFYQNIVGNIHRSNFKDCISISDVGCSNGSFINGLISAGIDGTFLGMDVSRLYGLPSDHGYWKAKLQD